MAGAAGALLIAPGPDRAEHVLLTLRSADVHQGGTWSIPGGAIDPGEDAHAAAVREVSEELGITIGELRVTGEHVYECGSWTYTTVLLAAPAPTPLVARGWETDDVRWFDVDEVGHLVGLHPSFASSWPALHQLVREHRAVS